MVFDFLFYRKAKIIFRPLRIWGVNFLFDDEKFTNPLTPEGGILRCGRFGLNERAIYSKTPPFRGLVGKLSLTLRNNNSGNPVANHIGDGPRF